jgi:tRNA A37 threonylcarbamoyladenosine modification protein TsaB
MGEAFLGVYTKDASGHFQCELTDMLVDPQRFRLADEYPGAFAAGAGWEEWPAMLVGHDAGKDSSVWPEAQAVLEIARDKYARGAVLKAYEALPNYVRDKVTH